MSAADEFDNFLVAASGFEATLFDEAKALHYNDATTRVGGVVVKGGWSEL